MVRWLVLLLFVPRLAIAEDRPALAFEAKELELAGRRLPEGVDVRALVAAAYSTAAPVDDITTTTSIVTFLRVRKIDLVTRSKTGWGKESLMAVLGCVGTYTKPATGAERVRCTPEVTLLAEQDGAWKSRAHVALPRFAVDWEIAGGNSASVFLGLVDYWPVAKQRSQLLEVGVARKIGDERATETIALAVYWLEDGTLREVLSRSYTRAQQDARGRRDVVEIIEEHDDHATRGVPDLKVTEQVQTFSNGKERISSRKSAYKWNGKKFVRAGRIAL